MIQLLLIGTITVTGIALIGLLWMSLDRRFHGRAAPREVDAIREKLRVADEERKDMRGRIETLEAIAADRPLHGGL